MPRVSSRGTGGGVCGELSLTLSTVTPTSVTDPVLRKEVDGASMDSNNLVTITPAAA